MINLSKGNLCFSEYNISKKGNNLLLRIKKFEIHRAACYLFKGEMASGKSLLINILNKRNTKYKGEIKYDSHNKISSDSKFILDLFKLSSEMPNVDFHIVGDRLCRLRDQEDGGL